MRRLVFILITVLAFSSTINIYAQSNEQQVSKAAKKEAKAKKKAEKEAMEMLSFNVAKNALINQSFVLQADMVHLAMTPTETVDYTTNFIAMEKGRVVVQVATSRAIRGANGLGGFTVDGAPSNIKMDVNKNGNVTFSFDVQGTSISAQVSISIPYGSNKAVATVYPNFSSHNLTMIGEIRPYSESRIFEGLKRF